MWVLVSMATSVAAAADDLSIDYSFLYRPLLVCCAFNVMAFKVECT